MYNLLLVDDEPLIKVAFQSAVEWGKNGFLLAATASNGQEALHIVETQHIDAVITDLKMPGMDGLALIHELKKRSFTGPILVLSNYSDFDSVRTALTDGAYDYFLKINMNGESIGEHLEKMADLLRVQQQRQTEEDHRSFAIEAQKKENALIHCAQWITSTAGSSPASNPFSMLPEPLVFPVRLFTVTLIPTKTHPMPALEDVYKRQSQFLFRAHTLKTSASFPMIAQSSTIWAMTILHPSVLMNCWIILKPLLHRIVCNTSTLTAPTIKLSLAVKSMICTTPARRWGISCCTLTNPS